jgi:stalled ribosome rescue protein Dom34
MKIIKFYESSGSLKLRVDTLEDLWTAQRIIFPNDLVKSESERKFKSNESDKGELKKVVIRQAARIHKA